MLWRSGGFSRQETARGDGTAWRGSHRCGEGLGSRTRGVMVQPRGRGGVEGGVADARRQRALAHRSTSCCLQQTNRTSHSGNSAQSMAVGHCWRRTCNPNIPNAAPEQPPPQPLAGSQLLLQQVPQAILLFWSLQGKQSSINCPKQQQHSVLSTVPLHHSKNCNCVTATCALTLCLHRHRN